MTIFTKAGTGTDKTDEKKALAEEPAASPADFASPRPVSLFDDAAYRQSVAEWYLALRRRRLLTSLCAALLIVWIVLAAIAGSILLFKYLHRKPVYYGWCGTSYINSERQISKFDERVEVDEANEIEKIEVPEFGPFRPGVFLHDFRQNLTAIIDVHGSQCFIKPLDRRQMKPPSGFIDLVRKIDTGYYDQNSAVIRERFTVRLPELSAFQLRNLESWVIVQQCGLLKTYMLDKVRSRHFLRRTRGARNEPEILKFIFYNGDGTMIQETVEIQK